MNKSAKTIRKAKANLQRIARDALQLRRGELKPDGAVDLNASGIEVPGAFSPANGGVIALTAGANPPLVVGAVAAHVKRTSSRSVSSGSNATIAWQEEMHDTAGLWDSGDATHLTAPVPGWYIAVAYFRWQGSNEGRRENYIYKNDSEVVAEFTYTGQTLAGLGITLPALSYLDAGDQLRLQVWQNSGGPLNVNSANMVMARLF